MTIKINKKTLGRAAALLAFISLVLWGVLDAIQYKVVLDLGILGKSETVVSYKGFKVLLGIVEKGESVFGTIYSVQVSNLNWMMLITYVLGLVGIFSMLIRRKLSKIGVISLILATVLLFLSPVYFEWFLVADQKEAITNLGDAISFCLATPAMISGVILGLASLLGIGSLLLKK